MAVKISITAPNNKDLSNGDEKQLDDDIEKKSTDVCVSQVTTPEWSLIELNGELILPQNIQNDDNNNCDSVNAERENTPGGISRKMNAGHYKRKRMELGCVEFSKEVSA